MARCFGGGLIHNQGIVTVSGPTRSNRGKLLNTDQIILTDGDLQMDAGSVLTNLSGTSPDPSTAWIRFAADSGIPFISGGRGANPVIINEGVIEKTGATGVSEIGVNVELKGNSTGNGAGTVDAQSGTIRFTGDVFGSGAGFLASQDAAIELAGRFYLSTDVSQTFTYTGSGAGHLKLVDGGAFLGTAIGNSGSSDIDSPRAILDFPGDFFEWVGGGCGNGTTRNEGQVNAVGSATRTMSARFDNAGQFVHRDEGAINSPFGSFMRVDTTGEYEFAGDGDIVRIGGGGAAPLIENRGIIRKSSGVGTSQVASNVTNSGEVRAESGTLEFAGQFSNTGSLHASTGTTLKTSNAVTVPAGETLSGGGTFDIPVLTVAGTVDPGDSPGVLTVLINFELQDGAIYEWEVSDIANDLVQVLGQLDFGATATLKAFLLLSGCGSRINLNTADHARL